MSHTKIGILLSMDEVKSLVRLHEARLTELEAQTRASGKPADAYPGETARLTALNIRLRDIAKQLAQMMRQPGHIVVSGRS